MPMKMLPRIVKWSHRNGATCLARAEVGVRMAASRVELPFRASHVMCLCLRPASSERHGPAVIVNRGVEMRRYVVNTRALWRRLAKIFYRVRDDDSRDSTCRKRPYGAQSEGRKAWRKTLVHKHKKYIEKYSSI